MFDYIDYMGFKTNKIAQDSSEIEKIIEEAVECAENGEEYYEFDALLLDDDEIEYIKNEVKNRIS